MRDKRTPNDVCGEANLTRKAPSTVLMNLRLHMIVVTGH